MIKRYADYFAHKLDTLLKIETLPPLERIKAFVADAEAGMARHNFKRGCLVGNLGQEMGRLPEQFREQLEAVFETWQYRVEVCLEAAKGAGEIAPGSDCKKLAKLFWIGWEGAVLRAKLERSPEPLTIFQIFISVPSL